MSDYNSSLPVRTENAGDVIIKVADATVTSQQLAINSDGSVNITDNGGSLTVDASNLDIRDLAFATDKVDVSGSSVTVTATDLDIRDLSHTSDSVKIGDGTDFLAINNDGSLNATVSATNLDIRDLVFASDKVDVSGSSVTVSSTDLDIRDLAFATDSVDVSGSSVTATVSATDLDIRDLSHSQDSIKIGDGTDFLAVNTDGSINVVVTDSSPGTATCDYNTAAAVAGGASSTHTYTSTGNFMLTQIEASGSGKMKIEVRVNSVTKFVQFNSTAETNMSIQISQPILATSGQTVTVIRTNRENQAQDLYSTILGYTV